MKDFTVTKIAEGHEGENYFKIVSSDDKKESTVYQFNGDKVIWRTPCTCGWHCSTPRLLYEEEEKQREKGIYASTAYLWSLFEKPVDLHQFL